MAVSFQVVVLHHKVVPYPYQNLQDAVASAKRTAAGFLCASP